MEQKRSLSDAVLSWLLVATLVGLMGVAFLSPDDSPYIDLVFPCIFIYLLVSTWKNQAAGVFKREDDPYIFWGAIVSCGGALIFLVYALSVRWFAGS